MTLDAKVVKEYRYTEDKPGEMRGYFRLPADGAPGLRVRIVGLRSTLASRMRPRRYTERA